MGDVRRATEREAENVHDEVRQRRFEEFILNALGSSYSGRGWRYRLKERLEVYVNTDGFSYNSYEGYFFSGLPEEGYYLLLLCKGISDLETTHAVEKGRVTRYRKRLFSGGNQYDLQMKVRTKNMSQALIDTQILIDKLKKRFPSVIIDSVNLDIAVIEEEMPDPMIESSTRMLRAIEP